jgi:autotransporter-associated beta strand protein
MTIFASNVLYGASSSAITFDTTNWTMTVSGNMTGMGGFNKRGTGDLVLSGTNSFSGPTRILEGAVVPAAAYALSTNSVVAFGVVTNGVGGTLRLPDGFSLANYTVGVANPEALDTGRNYMIASWSGSLAAPFGASALPGPWYVYYDWENKTAQLRAAIGTVIRLR